ncbi:MAG TPA: hypothetical protein VF529_04405 [Solirubrobacteraceae bacterium]|jgi:hypothetical protein
MTRATLAVLAAATIAVGAFVAWGNAADSSPPAANKTWVAGDTIEVMHKQVTTGVTEQQDEVVLSKNQIKFSNPQDLLLQLTAECALWTNTATTGDDDAETKARVETWVEIDGKVVPVSPNDTAPTNGSVDPDQQAGAGRVVLCNRATRMKTENIESLTTGVPDDPNTPIDESVIDDPDNEDDILIRSYNRTREANGFTWTAIDVGRNYDTDGDNVVDVEVHARLAGEIQDQDTTDNDGSMSPAALAAIGKRSLVIEPTRLAVRATTQNGETVAQQSALTRFRRMQVRK